VGEWLSEAFPVARAFDEEVVRAGFRPAQMVLLAFVVTFGCVRGYAHMTRRGIGPGNLSLGDTRIHHLVPGIFLLLGAGFAEIAFDPDPPWWLWWLIPTAFGVGAALVLDEYALWLHLRDVYWTEEGRRSIDAVIIATALIAMVALGAPFWGRVISGANPAGGAVIVAYHVLSVASALVCLAKGKWVTGVVGFLIWPVGLVGAVRPARPGSRWERWRGRRAATAG
jgi:lysyl-tRNA synthetase, class II